MNKIGDRVLVPWCDDVGEIVEIENWKNKDGKYVPHLRIEWDMGCL